MIMKSRLMQKLILCKSLMILPFIMAVISSCNIVSEKKEPGAEIYANDTIYHIVEVNPEYPGGQAEMRNFLQANLIYPEKAMDEGAEGTVFTSFVVEPNGEITNVQIIRGVNEDLNQEAVRVVKQMQKWTPGNHEGKPVRVRLHLPVKFVLQANEEITSVN
jgi:TonB family protein